MSSFKALPLFEATELRRHLQANVRGLRERLPRINEPKLLDNLCFLLNSSLFLQVVAPQPSDSEANTTGYITPISNTPENTVYDFEVSKIKMRMKRIKGSWATQLLYDDTLLIQGRGRIPEQEPGLLQSFYWFRVQADRLASKYRAQEKLTANKTGKPKLILHPPKAEVDDRDDAKTRSRGSGNTEAQQIWLKIRFRDTSQGPMGLWVIKDGDGPV